MATSRTALKLCGSCFELVMGFDPLKYTACGLT